MIANSIDIASYDILTHGFREIERCMHTLAWVFVVRLKSIQKYK